MMFKSANRALLLFASIFILVLGVTLAGAYYYKQTLPPSAESILTGDTGSATSDAPTSIEEQNEVVASADLQLIPTNAEQTTYRLLVTNLTEPITGVAFQLTSSPEGAQLVSNQIELSSALSDSGWSTALNSSSSTDSNQEFSFSMVNTSPGNKTAVSSLEIGTVSFDRTPTATDLQLNPDESLVTYSENKIAPLTLVLETDTMEN